MTVVKQNRVAYWAQLDGSFDPFVILDTETFGGDDATLPGAGRDSEYVSDENGNPIILVAAETPPGGLPSFNLQFVDTYAQNALRLAKSRGLNNLVVHKRKVKSGILTNPTAWQAVEVHFGGAVGDITSPGSGIDYSGASARGSAAMTFTGEYEYIFPVLTALNLDDVVADALDVVMVGDVIKDVPNYPGPDKIGFIAQQAASGVAAKLVTTADAFSTVSDADADPFGTDEHIQAVVYKLTDAETGGRVIVGNASAAEIAYADFTYSDPSALSWTTVATTGNVTALGWRDYNELIIVTASGAYISRDAGASVAVTLVTNANLTGIAFSPQDPNLEPYAYLYGASNTILRKLKGVDSVDTLVGPSGGGAFTSLAVAKDGTIYAGNGQALYRSTDGATTAAGWTQVYDAGSGKTIAEVRCVGGDSRALIIVVAGTAGTVFTSIDGGNTMQAVTIGTNSGLNAAWFSPTNPNFGVIVGDDDTTEPLAFKLGASS